MCNRLIRIKTRRIFTFFALVLFCLTTSNAHAKDCEIEIQHKKLGATNISVAVTGINKGENKHIWKTDLRFLKNRKSHQIKALISQSPGSNQRRWITLQALNQKVPVTGNYQLGIDLFQIICPQENTTSGLANSCPRGTGAKICSGNGICNASTGQCDCKSEDYSGNACQIMSQRCYGAIGNNCGAADGFSNPGLCADNLCQINVGSWEHDECCVAYRKNGTAPESQQGSCTPFPFAPGPYAANCVDLFKKAVAHYADSNLTWVRVVDFNKITSGIGSFRVNHADMCNKSGGSLKCSDSKYCCSRQSTRISIATDTCICQ